jgi:hypothetical protein
MRSIIAILLSLVVFELPAQRSIVLTDPQGVDQWIISEGDKVKFELRGDFHGFYKGKVQEVKDSSFVVRDKEIFFSKVKTIKLSRKPARKAIVLGLFMAGIGAAAQPVNEQFAQNAVPASTILISQIAFIGTGTFFIIRGIVEAASNHKFRLYEGWSMRSIPFAQLRD